jgi:hypothetical protein
VAPYGGSSLAAVSESDSLSTSGIALVAVSSLSLLFLLTAFIAAWINYKQAKHIQSALSKQF